ncbi:hypothetical protein EBU94_05205 [bacterium]|nr:hypothetical protein [bacterium]
MLTDDPKWPYTTSIEPIFTKQHEDEIFKWCLANIGMYDVKWTTYYDSLSHRINVKFKSNEDCAWFTLRWS